MSCIYVEGARQNNLKGVTLNLPLNKLIVVTGVSGSGKSSLAFDTVYAEGQRRYVETFSAYTRQFLDRMDRPRVDRIEGIPPAIAIDQTNPVRTSRSTVGTMTEINDHLKLFFARAACLYCKGCGKPVRRDTPESIAENILDISNRSFRDEKIIVLITFPVKVPEGFPQQEVMEALAIQGYRKIHRKVGETLEVIQDRIVPAPKNRTRLVEGLESAMKYGRGVVIVHLLDRQMKQLETRKFSEDLHCADCDIHYNDPVPNFFSFNSPIGACQTCRGFGRIIDIDYGLVIPDENKTLNQGAVKPFQSESYRECQDDLLEFAVKRGIPTDVPWNELTEEQKKWVLEGEGKWEDGKWYGVKRFFKWLETKSYKMHIRVLLSRYRAYRVCPACGGARLKPDSLQWKIGDGDGLNIHQIQLLPIDRCYQFFRNLKLPSHLEETTGTLLKEIKQRLRYLIEVGLGYLTLDRQSRTLSGGEVQRINLTTALGTSLVNTLFVLDEPSIGLHPRDIGRLIRILHRLRDSGNTLLVVEHDPEVIKAADYIVDMGPGAGEKGGEVVFFGEYKDLLKCETSLTAQYLTGKKKAIFRINSGKNEKPDDSSQDGVSQNKGSQEIIKISGAEEHNLKNIDVEIPLQRLVCITGVSGSGKSTLIEDVFYRALKKLKHRPVESPGKYRGIEGEHRISDVVLVDQSPIGKTTRSNPASYVGAFDSIRKIFASQPLAMERGYTSGTFSFNSGTGRCPACKGNGFQHIEMQFLSDVYIRCPDCDGKRYRPEVLEVKLIPSKLDDYSKNGNENGFKPASISDVLQMTVSEAQDFFWEYPEVYRALEPLKAVGLGYMTLGQPVPTLSGGEAQRLKLAGYLARSWKGRKGGGNLLFLLDEPTTGLHFHDIASLLEALRRLIQWGHSVVVIEHNLEVISSADWIIDLGPEGGDDGGRVVCQGTPIDVLKCRESHTGKALNKIFREFKEKTFYEKEIGVLKVAEKRREYKDGENHSIFIRSAREHNLKNIDIRIPRETFTVITGVSGSGKSTVAFDILFSEGQRRYLESLNAYARQFVQPASRPDVDGVFGVPPTVAIEQRTSRGGRKSTVATMTEIYHFLRLLFARLGTQFCPECGVPIEPQSEETILSEVMKRFRGKRVVLLAPLVSGRKGYYTDLARWAQARGYSHLRVDGVMIPTKKWPRLDRFREHNIELPVEEIKVSPDIEKRLKEKLHTALNLGKGNVYVAIEKPESPQGYSKWDQVVFSTSRACPECGRSFEEPDPRLFSFNSPHGWCPHCYGTGLLLSGFDETQSGEEIWWNQWWEGPEALCEVCNGTRLRKEALAVRFRGKNIAEITSLTVEEAEKYFGSLELTVKEELIARDILSELLGRLSFLKKVGLSYLTLNRSAPTLSSGEAQRIRLASQLGSNLRGVCYILDEPTIGLHVRDNRMLLETLEELKSRGNTIVVVEHDEETIRKSEYIIDLGPGGGINGGRLMAEGTLEELLKKSDSITGKFLKDPLKHPLIVRSKEKHSNGRIRVYGASLHNLKDIDVDFPLGNFICVTGVSGSGKSTLVRDVLYNNLKKLVDERRKQRGEGKYVQPVGCREVAGWEDVKRVLEVDQSPIGKTPRSCPATYVGFWSDIRQLFAGTVEARMRGYRSSRFSFNVPGGRCEECAGQGIKRIEMSFLPDVTVSCEVCEGKRFNTETLEIKYKGKNIWEVLNMSVEEACEFFSPHPKVFHALKLLEEVGLGYITLGQPSPTLSGGEAQRIKLVTELARASGAYNSGLNKGNATQFSGNTLYVLDEPTIGLHMVDVEKLIHVLLRLVDAGNTVVVIEHNMDIIAEADWIIDLGPEGGERGGNVVAQGSPWEIVRNKNGSYTARFLEQFLLERASC